MNDQVRNKNNNKTKFQKPDSTNIHGKHTYSKLDVAHSTLWNLVIPRFWLTVRITGRERASVVERRGRRLQGPRSRRAVVRAVVLTGVVPHEDVEDLEDVVAREVVRQVRDAEATQGEDLELVRGAHGLDGRGSRPDVRLPVFQKPRSDDFIWVNDRSSISRITVDCG